MMGGVSADSRFTAIAEQEGDKGVIDTDHEWALLVKESWQKINDVLYAHAKEFKAQNDSLGLTIKNEGGSYNGRLLSATFDFTQLSEDQRRIAKAAGIDIEGFLAADRNGDRKVSSEELKAFYENKGGLDRAGFNALLNNRRLQAAPNVLAAGMEHRKIAGGGPILDAPGRVVFLEHVQRAFKKAGVEVRLTKSPDGNSGALDLTTVGPKEQESLRGLCINIDYIWGCSRLRY